jgi:hypothetical protein
MPDSVISLLVQIPIVAAFIWFTLKIRDEERHERKDRDNDWRGWLKEEHTEFMLFLTEERNSRAVQLEKSFGILSAELKGITETLNQNNAEAATRTAAAIEQVVGRISERDVRASSR